MQLILCYYLDALAEYPKLIERPILIENNRALIGRPVEKVIEFLIKQ